MERGPDVIKSGDVFLEVSACDGDGKIEWDEWVVRSIRKGRIFVTMKTSFTWGKKSKKHGDFGWLDPIEALWRRSWRVGEEPYGQLATTRMGAIKKAIEHQKKWGDDSDYDEPGMNAKIIKRLETMLAKERGKRARKKGERDVERVD